METRFVFIHRRRLRAYVLPVASVLSSINLIFGLFLTSPFSIFHYFLSPCLLFFLSLYEESAHCTVYVKGREVLDIAGRAVAVGVTCDQLDAIVHQATIDRNAYPSPLNYYQFPKSVCTSG